MVMGILYMNYAFANEELETLLQTLLLIHVIEMKPQDLFTIKLFSGKIIERTLSYLWL